MQHQFSVMAERVNAMVAGLQRQSETDRRRLVQLERKLDNRLEDRARENDGREKWAEIQGSVNGLIEENISLTRRVEGLDERLWARTSGTELTKQRNREIEQQVQSLEQQSRLASSTLEEAHKRHATKLRRAEHAIEESTRRLAKVEEEMRLRQQQAGHQRDNYLEARVGALEDRIDSDVRALQMQLDEGLHGAALMSGPDPQSIDEAGARVDEAVRAMERSMALLDKRLVGQVEELASSLASMRVKVDGQLQRVEKLAERLETAHEPALESLRAELSQVRQQDKREADGESSSLRGRLQEAIESNEDHISEIREALRQVSAEIAALSLRPEDSTMLCNLDERLGFQEQELCEVRARLDAFSAAEVEAAYADEEQKGDMVADGEPCNELDDVRRRLEWIEEQSAAGAAADRADQRQAQNTVCELVESVSRLKQQALTSEGVAFTLQQQVQQLQSMAERRLSEDAASARLPAELEARVGELWDKVAELHARLLEVEGGMDLAREQHDASAASAPLHSGRGGGDPGHDHQHGHDGSRPPKTTGAAAASSRDAPTAEMKEKLIAVAEHLEVVDELVDRVSELERKGNSALGNIPHQGAETILAAKVQADFRDFRAELETVQNGLEKQDLRCSRLDKEVSALEEKVRDELPKLGAVLQRVASLDDDAKSQRTAHRELSDRFSDFGASLRESAAHGHGTGTDEMKAEIEKVRETVRSLNLDLRSTEERLNEKSAKQCMDLASRLRDVEGRTGGTEADDESRLEMQRQVDQLRRKLESEVQQLSGNLKEIGEALGQRMQELESSSKEDKTSKLGTSTDSAGHRQMQVQLDSLRRGVQELKDKALAAEELQDEVRELRTNLSRAGSGPADLAKRLRALEEKQDKPNQANDDVRVREQLQEQVEMLGKEVARELSSLTALQSEVVGARASIEAIKDREITGEGALRSIREQVEAITRRLSAAEGSTNTMKAELEQLGGGPRKVGIGIGGDVGGSPMALVRHRIDLLGEQVAELQQSCGRGTARRRGFDSAEVSASPPVSRPRSRSPDASLNFSLTEHTERHGAGEGSLNFSLTESKQDFSFSEGASNRRARIGLGDAPAPSAAECHSGDNSPTGSASVDSPVDTPIEGIGDALDAALAGGSKSSRQSTGRDGDAGGGGDVLDSLMGGAVGGASPGGTMGSRPKPSPLKLSEVELERSGSGLAPVAEESSDLGDMSFESQKSGSQKKSHISIRPEPQPSHDATSGGNLGTTNPDSPSGSAGSIGNLDVSISCNEVSIGHDISVEDSAELDKCDFIELVKPNSARGQNPDIMPSNRGHDISVEDSSELDKCDFVEIVRPNPDLKKEAPRVAESVRNVLGGAFQSARTASLATGNRARSHSGSSDHSDPSSHSSDRSDHRHNRHRRHRSDPSDSDSDVELSGRANTRLGISSVGATTVARASPERSDARDEDPEYESESFEDNVSIAEDIAESSGSDHSSAVSDA